MSFFLDDLLLSWFALAGWNYISERNAKGHMNHQIQSFPTYIRNNSIKEDNVLGNVNATVCNIKSQAIINADFA